ncbi:PilT-like protein [Tolypothrix sp. NIES-4075]|uniref:hypothetical protein n=1 Tax=Tolypothrix sp. NIES-4075 TaxID=2005459 RepID=UPI000B674B0D|nr:hypothetical protein [Tolypothrix sp. NIES-4075]GAX43652.1 PilT-like protein [Tolypothrix sp. NIES-4075]
MLTLQLPDAELAGRIYADLERTGQPIGLADSMIAAICASQQRFAIASQNNLTLITGNLPHYQRLQSFGYSLKLDNWRT